MVPMKTLEKGQDKIKKICSVLRDETLEPAKKQAEEIVKEGQRQAEEIIAQAQVSAEKIIDSARTAIEQERNVFYSIMQQAAKQSLEALRQDIEKKFFSEHLQSVIEKNTQSADIIAKLVNAIVKALEKEGLSSDLTALVPNAVSPKEVNDLLLQDVLKTLKEKSVVLGNFSGGVRLKLNNKQMSIDITEDAIKELLANYIVRKDFRKMLFAD